MRYLLDTCVVSELVKPAPHPGVIRWLQEREEETLFLSVLTFGELQKEISKLPPGPRQEMLREWVATDLVLRFSGRTLDIDTDVAVAWGEMQGEAESRGERLPVMDSLIAATAVVRNLTVVTRNTKDIERCGVGVFNPWEF
jgi:toxin FitB